jgi:hypothetical protein
MTAPIPGVSLVMEIRPMAMSAFGAAKDY